MNRQMNSYRAFAALVALAVLLVWMAAIPLRVRAEGEVPSDPEPVTPPPIMGRNAGVTLSEGDKGEIDPSGMLTDLEIEVPLLAEPPHYVEVVPQEVETESAHVPSLAVPLRYQDPGAVTCGAAALGMALDFLEVGGEGGSAPSTLNLVDDLKRAGLLYKGVGTGVEELAYIARQNGYQGSYAFHDWGLEQLQKQLTQGRPVLAALGANGEGQPGHFVTVTGISADRQWISYNDPTLGKRTISSAEFLRLWRLQGSSGLVVQKKSLPAASDPMLPWMGLFGAISMMAVLVGRASAREDLKEVFYHLRKKLSDPRRKGLGGRLNEGSPPENTKLAPVYGYQAVQQGFKTVEKEVPVYETKRVKTGYKVVTRRVPNYVPRKIQVGMKRVTRRVPRYVEKRVQVGTKKVMEKVKVTRYRTEPYSEWKKETKKMPVYRTKKYVKRYRNKRIKDWKVVRKNGRFTLQPTYRWKRVPVYGKKKVCVGHRTKTEMKRVKRLRSVPYTVVETRTKRVPIYETKKVQDGYRMVNEIVPVYDYRTFQEGWKTVHESVPVYEEQRVQVGTKTVTESVPNYVLTKVQSGGEDPDPPEPDDDLEEDWARMRELLVYNETADADPPAEMDAPPPWDDELRRFGELDIDEKDEFLAQEYYHGLYNEMLNEYAENNIDWEVLIKTPEDNPLMVDDLCGEWTMVTQLNAQNVVDQKFIKDLGLDKSLLSNYEPIYLENLKLYYPTEYKIAKDWYKEQWEDKENNGFLAEAFELDEQDQFNEFIESIANGYSFINEN